MRQLTASTIVALIAILFATSVHGAPVRKQDVDPADMPRVTLRDGILKNITGAEISPVKVSILKFGAKADGKKDCLKAFNKAMQRATRDGALRLVFPAGTYYMRGPLHLVSNVTLELEEGATIKFDPDPTLYPTVATSWEGTFLHNYSPMIYGYGLHDVAIIGRGTIDGNASATFATWRQLQKADQALSREMNHTTVPVAERVFGTGHYLRPHLIQFYNCEKVTLEGVKITNSPFWCVHLLKSENIVCRSLRYDARLVNNDGIDPECSRNILIEDVEFDNGDDNIAIKSGRDNDGWTMGSPSENIVIRGCRFKGLHAVVIGSEMSGGVRNIIIEDCNYGGYCKRGIYVKTNPDRGGFANNIYVKNCTFGDVEDLFYITSRYAGEGTGSAKLPEVCDIFVDGLRCKRASGTALVIQGGPDSPVSNIEFRNVEVDSAASAISFTSTRGVTVNDSRIGREAGTPTQVTAGDRIFDR